MKIEKKIVIEEKDVSDLHSEITDIIDVFLDNAVGDSGEEFVKTEFPTVMRLKRLLETVVLGEPSEQIYDRLSETFKPDPERVKRISRHLRVVKMVDGKDSTVD